MTDKLSLPERTELQECEAVIQRGMGTFLDVGRALLAIRDGKLYRSDHETFEAYAKARWNMSRPRAYQLIDAVEVEDQLANLSTTGRQNLERSERAYRELASVPDEELPGVVEAAAKKAGDQPITAKVIREAKDEVLGESKPKPAPDWKHLRDTGKSKAESLLRTIDDLQGAKKSRSHAVAVDYAKKIITTLEEW